MKNVSFLKQIFLTAFILWGTSIFTCAQDSLSLQQVQEQARRDLRITRESLGSQADKLLPAMLAFTPLLRFEATRYAHALSDVLATTQLYQDLGKAAGVSDDLAYLLSTDEKQAFELLSQQLKEGKFYEATRTNNIMWQKGGWKKLIANNDFEVNLPVYIDEFLNVSVPKHIALGEAPAREFYVGTLDDEMISFAIAGDKASLEYNSMRDILDVIEKDHRKLSSKNIRSRLQPLYETSYWGEVRVFDASAEEFFTQLAKDYPKLAKDQSLLVRYLGKIENVPTFSREVKNALQANLLARSNQLTFHITPLMIIEEDQTKLLELITMESKIADRYSAVPIIKESFRKFLPMAGLLMFTAVLINTTTDHHTNAEDLKMLQRLQQNFDLFTEATPEDLKKIERHPMAEAYCRTQAGALHQMVTMPKQELDFVAGWTAQLLSGQQLQAPHRPQRARATLLNSRVRAH